MSAARGLTGLAILGLTVVSLSGCVSAGEIDCSFANSNESARASNSLSVIIAPSEDFIDFPTVLESAMPELENSISNGDLEISLITGDGKPRLFSKQAVVLDDAAEQIEVDRSIRLALQPLKMLGVCLSTNDADDFVFAPESDLFGALGQAVRAFPEGSSGPSNQILLVGNGLITAGQWSFVENGGIPAPENLATVVEEISSAGLVPDLNGATVNIYGLGQTNPSGTMAPLTNPTRDALRNFWTALIEANNGVVGTLDDGLVEIAPKGKTFTVSDVSSLPTPCLESKVLTEQSGFSFKPDSTDFVDRAKAVAVAKEIVASVDANKCVQSITVTGFVASGTSKGSYAKGSGDVLSKKRASAFATLLAANGLSKQIAVTIVGGGKGPFVDWDSSGNFVEKAGARNRFAVVSFGE